MYLGRFQKGMKVPLSVAVVDGGGAPAFPDTAPAALVAEPGGATIGAVELAYAGAPWVFGAPLFLDVSYATLGTYSVTYVFRYAEGAGQGTAVDTFDLIAGGDEGGAVVSMFALDRPEARYVVAQLASGRLVQGRNPRL